ncbi:hypothetical protein ASPACDRAFT_1860763 [Aspergillus aculeatus ATCC 16872]|uniref:Uncharacterized protein n=1 Tax=Aspergillus aculeatus (strain ATCC 16872 / CBS 172.66 / WB 5094) TaxID=690307 RepID=A0A1L9WF13_ASPA1|nr:uncharacterized protein ASPACDRAFT_1860763 [Aspergillus aculeatus ATCC 16872]OJJ94760.1 hypothetical protein ASPACDRAFT_1860763 [Aspergillus aculeatus ATCC 16872]
MNELVLSNIHSLLLCRSRLIAKPCLPKLRKKFGREITRLFSPCLVLEEYGQRFADRPITSEKDLEVYERFAVENHVFDIILAQHCAKY